MKTLTALLTMLCQLLLSAWLGGAVLFVITSIAEQTSPAFESLVKDQLATIRFPLYYTFGFSILCASLLCLILLTVLPCDRGRRRIVLALALVVISTGIAAYDYTNVYRPLQKMIIPPGQSRTVEFISLHKLSARINMVHLSFAGVAAMLLCLPAPGLVEHRGQG